MLSPTPDAHHAHALLAAMLQLAPQLPSDIKVLHNLDTNLELAPPDAPGFTRRPD